MECALAVCNLKRKSKVGEIKLSNITFIRKYYFPENAFGLNDTLGELMNTTPFLVQSLQRPG